MISDLLALRKSNSVSRYHTETLLLDESVGQHVANVCMILCWMYKHVGIPARVLRAAVLHDVAEVYTGDAPAPVKWEYSKVEEGLKMAERDFWRKLVGWDNPYDSLTLEELAVVKFADMADLCLKCIHERELGNNTLNGMYLRGIVVMEQRSADIPSNLESKANTLMEYIRSMYDESK